MQAPLQTASPAAHTAASGLPPSASAPGDSASVDSASFAVASPGAASVTVVSADSASFAVASVDSASFAVASVDSASVDIASFNPSCEAASLGVTTTAASFGPASSPPSTGTPLRTAPSLEATMTGDPSGTPISSSMSERPHPAPNTPKRHEEPPATKRKIKLRSLDAARGPKKVSIPPL